MRVWKWGYESEKFETITFPMMSEVFDQYFDPYFNGLPINDKWGGSTSRNLPKTQTC